GRRFSGKSDPFVEFYWDDEEEKAPYATPVIKADLNPNYKGVLIAFEYKAPLNLRGSYKTVGIFGGDALRRLAAATSAEQVERIEAFDTLKVNPYEGKEGENLHFWVREVELAMDAALISTERLRVALALSNQKFMK
ncbi:Gag protein, partial [Phytophthora palmivora]